MHPNQHGHAAGKSACKKLHFLNLNFALPLIIYGCEKPTPCLQDIRERPMRKITIEEKWHQQSEAAKIEADKLPGGKERDALVRKARQLQTASQINQWLSSPELKSPD
jgi:hypothetical protein